MTLEDELNERLPEYETLCVPYRYAVLCIASGIPPAMARDGLLRGLTVDELFDEMML